MEPKTTKHNPAGSELQTEGVTNTQTPEQHLDRLSDVENKNKLDEITHENFKYKNSYHSFIKDKKFKQEPENST